MPGMPRMVIRYQLRGSTEIRVYANADRWCDAVALKAACAAEHGDARAVWIDAHDSVADGRTAVGRDAHRGAETDS